MKSTHMQAAVVEAPRRVVLTTVARPEPGPQEVRVRLEGCGVCGSNLPPWEGRPWFKYPLAPGQLGHEGWGRVDAVGSGASRFQAGDRVALLSAHAFAEFDVAPEDSVVKLPDVLDGRPFPGEALGCALNVFRRCQVERGQRVAIVGIGFLGAVLTSLAAHAGARVLALSRRPFALQTARRLGAAEALSLEDLDRVRQRVQELTGGKGFPRVIEAVGQQESLDVASELTGERGRLIIAGYHQDGPRQVNLQQWNWHGIDVINAHERDPTVYTEGIGLAAAAVASGQLDPSPLYTHTFPLEQLGEALNALAQRPDGFLKALITL